MTTLEIRKMSIPLNSLPRTFQDAIVITRKLGLRYIWIDSLCILQDSREDWEKESTMMGEIYASGYLNIAARGAVNAESGCFFSRDPEPPACRLVYESPDQAIVGSMYIRDPSYQTELIRDAPLDNRGWVLQERLLSPRIVYYGRQQIYWECAEATIRQDGKGEDVPTDDLRTGLHFKNSMNANVTATSYKIIEQMSLDKPFERRQLLAARLLPWYNTVTEYSRRNLTFSSDKLPAIAGIAKYFHEKLDITYIAGLWKEDPIMGLAWIVNAAEVPISETLPSWSWARWKSKVTYFPTTRTSRPRDLDDACTLIGVESTPLSFTMRQYGELHAELYVTGHVIPVIYRRPPVSEFDYLKDTVFTTNGKSIGRVWFDTCLHKPDTFSCLLIHGGVGDSVALALETDQHRTDCFQRIGYVSMSSNGSGGRKPFKEADARAVCLI
ncbi:MAG: hypothetical protein Q9178_007521 [Gyalolechia marmorata]